MKTITERISRIFKIRSSIENPLRLRREFCEDEEFPQVLSLQQLERWSEEIPCYSENDPTNREWKETPIKELDLTKYGYGKVLLKDESVNPTGTIKDRAAWEITTIYRDWAKIIYEDYINGFLTKSEIQAIKIPSFSLITSGNEGRAVSEAFKRFYLPPPKLIIPSNTDEKIKESVKELRADHYVVDLDSQALTTQDIKIITNNTDGIDLTSLRIFNPEKVFYDWHVFESFNLLPDNIFIPFGSGKLTACYFFWQRKLVADSMHRENIDPRLDEQIVARDKIRRINLYAAKPEAYPSIADKLHAPHRPFSIFTDNDCDAVSNLGFSGNKSGIYGISEEPIKKAYKILQQEGVQCEASSAASLALYMDSFDKGFVNSSERSLIINTGRGLCVDDN